MRIAKGGCKIWTGALNSSGYPVVREGNKIVLAHRKALGYTGDQTVHHTCGNKRCVNPAHLTVKPHAENAGDTKESRKEKCKFGHDLSDAYASRDGEGRVHRQCRTCKLLRESGKGPVAKHLEGKHDQKLHGNWANKVAGSISSAQKRRIIERLSGPDRKTTIENLASWMKEQDSDLPLMGWVDRDGSILDIGIGTARRTPKALDEKDPGLKPTLRFRLAMALDDAIGGKITSVDDRNFGVVPHEDRLQRLMTFLQSPGTSNRRNHASDLVLRGPRAIPTGKDLKAQAKLGIEGTHWVESDGKTRSVRLDFERLGDINLEEALRVETGRELGAREYNALRADGLEHQEALNRVNDRTKTHRSGSLMRLLSNDEHFEVWDKALALTAGKHSGVTYAVDGKVYHEGRPTQMRKFEIEVPIDELEEAIFSKHLLGRHDQKSHARKDHELIREIKQMMGEKGKVNLLRDETKDPKFKVAIDRIKRLRESISRLDPEDEKYDQRYEQRIERAVNSAAKDIHKHLVGRHNQKSHGHRRGEHQFLKELNGKLNLVINETKRDPSLRIKLDRLGYKDVTGRDLDADTARAVEVAQLLRGDELRSTQRTNVMRGILVGQVDMDEVDRFFTMKKTLPKEELDSIINAIRFERREEGLVDVPAADRERFILDRKKAEESGDAFLRMRGAQKQAESRTKKPSAEDEAMRDLDRLEDADLASEENLGGSLISGDNPYADLLSDSLKIKGIDKRHAEAIRIRKHLLGLHDQKKHGKDEDGFGEEAGRRVMTAGRALGFKRDGKMSVSEVLALGAAMYLSTALVGRYLINRDMMRHLRQQLGDTSSPRLARPLDVDLEQAKNIFDGFEHNGIKARVRETYLLDDFDGGSIISVEGTLRHEGRVVGMFHRTLNTSRGTTYHALFELDEAHQGTGFGRAFVEHSMSEYKKMGFKTTSLYANIDVGGYAWARMGFKPEAPGTAFEQAYYLRSIPDPRINGLGPDGDRLMPILEKARKSKESITMDDWDFVMGLHKDTQKAALLGTAWKGKMDLTKWSPSSAVSSRQLQGVR